MFSLFYTNPRLLALLLGFITVAGLGALKALPVQEDPELTTRFGIVRAYFPGASADRVETLVTEPLERAILSQEGVQEINSRSIDGIAAINVQLDDAITEVDEVWSRVRNVVAETQSSLPAQVRPEFEKLTTAASAILVAFPAHAGAPDGKLEVQTRLAMDLQQKLVSLAGTYKTDLYGDIREEILVAVDPVKLAASGLTPQAVAAALAASDAKRPAGMLETPENRLLVKVTGDLDNLTRVRETLIATPDGQRFLRVGDVAEVTRAAHTPRASVVLVNGREAVVLAAQPQAGYRLDEWTDRAKATIARFGADLTPDQKPVLLFDQAIYTQDRLGSLALNLVLGALLVILVVFVMMGWRAAITVSAALPITLAATLPALLALGVPLHQVSVTGLIVSLGLVIDNAIIASDDYRHRRADGTDRLRAMRETGNYLKVPMTAATLTTVFTFTPLILMPGNAGEFVKALGISVVISILISLFVALCLIPPLTAFLERLEFPWARRLGGEHGIDLPEGRTRWDTLLAAAFRRPGRTALLCAAVPVLGFLIVPMIPQQFFPPVDRDQFHIQLEMPPTASLAETRKAAERARGIVLAHEEANSIVWFIGDQPPRVYYNTTIKTDGAVNVAWAFVNTASAEQTAQLVRKLHRELAVAVPEARVLAQPFEQGPPVEAPLEVRLYGEDLATLQDLGERLRAIMAASDGVVAARARVSAGGARLELVPRMEALAVAGLSPEDLAARLSDVIDGTTGGSVLEGTTELPVRVRADTALMDRAQDLANLYLAQPVTDAGPAEGTGILLSGVADITLGAGVPAVTRWNGERVNIVQGFVEPFALASISLADFRARMAAADFSLPPGYRMEFGGEEEGSNEAQGNLAAVFLPLLLLLLGTIVLAFNSFTAAGLIWLTAILSMGVALMSLAASGLALGFMSIIGVMGLIGIVVNDSIVVLLALRSNPLCRTGDADAVRHVIMRETRHIVSTSLTTLGGFLPLIIWGGSFWPPMALPVVSGVMGGTVLALLFVPSLFLKSTRVRNSGLDPV